MVDMSIHTLDAHQPHVHCSRTVAKLLSDLDIPPFIVRTHTRTRGQFYTFSLLSRPSGRRVETCMELG